MLTMPFGLMPFGGKPKLLAYSNTNLAAGTNTLNIFTSISSQVCFLRKLGFRYTGTTTNVTVTFGILWGGTTYNLQTFATLTTARWNLFQADLWFTTDMTVVATITNATLGNDFDASLSYDEIRSDR